MNASLICAGRVYGPHLCTRITYICNSGWQSNRGRCKRTSVAEVQALPRIHLPAIDFIPSAPLLYVSI